MKLQLNTPDTLKIFTAHGKGYVEINGRRLERAVALTPEGLLPDWTPREFSALDESHFTCFLPLRPELILLGTGAQQHFPHPQLYRQLIAARIAVECMDTPAACRTYNILAAEGRKVVAAILL